MKSHLLLGIESAAIAKEALRTLLPGQEEPWLLCSSVGDPIVYFNVGTQLDGEAIVHVQADVSGRHYNDDAAVLQVLKQLQSSVGGFVADDT
jgi:hypothetical protein